MIFATKNDKRRHCAAQNSMTFELCLSVRPSVRGKQDCIRKQRATDFKIFITHTLVGIDIGPQDLVPPI